MKLSDIKGERSLDVIADAMELVDGLSGDERVEAFIDDLRAADGDGQKVFMAFCRHLPQVVRENKRQIVGILSAAAGMSAEEYAENGNVLGDLFGLLTEDDDLLGFLTPSASTAE